MEDPAVAEHLLGYLAPLLVVGAPGSRRGRRATIDAVRNGGVLGLRCIATRLPAMTVMLLSHQLLLMAAVAVVLWGERIRGLNPAERVAHPAQAGALLALAAAVAAG